MTTQAVDESPRWQKLNPQRKLAGSLYQTSVMAALIDGIYEGETTFAELEKHGDFGLGTFNRLDGEMVAHAGSFYQLRSDGSARQATLDQQTPFAAVTFFCPDKELKIAHRIDKTILLQELERAVDVNLFAAIQLTGTFQVVSTRTVKQQVQPFPPLTTAAENEGTNRFANAQGVMIGFWTPAFAQGIGVAGFHLHFLSEDRQTGGHVLDFIALDVVVQIARIHNIEIQLPTSEQFLKADLTGASLDEAIRASEG